MEIFLGIGCVLLGIGCVHAFWKLGRAVSAEQYEAITKAKQENEIILAKSVQKEEFLQKNVEGLTTRLEREIEMRQAAERTLESTTAYLQAQQDKLKEQREELEKIRSQFNNEFHVLANRILEEKTQKFTDLNKQNLGLLLDPLKERIKLFEDKIEKSYHQEAAERNVLKGVVEQLMQQTLQIQTEAHNLTRALKGDSKKQGNWGEVILERVLERSGLNKGQEYRLQASIVGEDNRRLQPDAIIELPDNKQLVVDSKVSLTSYERYVNAETEEERIVFLKQHIQSLENHVRDLSAKNYHSLYGINSPDLVFLFMPIEPALSVAVMHRPELFSEAWDRKVVIVSPSTLLATLRTIAATWKQERQNRNVVEIAKEAGLLYDKFVGFLDDMQQIQVYLSKASEKHEDAMKKLSSGPGNVTRKIENLKALGAKANRQIGGDFLEG